MAAPTPLPPRLRGVPFSVGEGGELGLGRRRMHGSDLERPFRGVRQDTAPTTVEALARAYFSRMPASHTFCTITAAVLFGVPLPLKFERPGPIHVAVPRGYRAPRARGVVGHKLDLAPHERIVRRGFPVTSPERTWCDLAIVLGLDDLVAAGDYLIHHRRPLVTLARLDGKVFGLGSRRGVTLLRQALPLLDPRSESRKESLLRLVLRRGGIDGLQSNYWITLPRLNIRYRVDFAIPALKVAIEYQSDYHRDPAQWRRDMTRISRLEAEGWVVIQVNADDMADPAELIVRIRLVLARRTAGR